MIKRQRHQGIAQEMSDIVIYCQPTKDFVIESKCVEYGFESC